MTGGERRFAERLEDKPEDDHLPWYDARVESRSQHPDFIVLHPRRGLPVLEVRDWRLDTIKRLDGTRDEIVVATG